MNKMGGKSTENYVKCENVQKNLNKSGQKEEK